MIIPHQELSPDALTSLIEDVVSRDGTELSDLASKVSQVRRRLERGEVFVTFDEDSETVGLVSKRELSAHDAAEQAED